MPVTQLLIAGLLALQWEFPSLVAPVKVEPEGKKNIGFMPDGKYLYRNSVWYINVLNKYLKRNINNEIKKYLNCIKEELQIGLISSGRYFEEVDPPLPRLVIHGDYSPNNLLINNTKVRAVLDFGDANLNLRVADVGRGLCSFTMQDGKKINEKLVRVFMKYYNAKLPLIKEEIYALPDIMVWRYLMNIMQLLFNEMEAFPNLTLQKDHIKIIQQKWISVQHIKSQESKLRSLFISLLE